MSYEPVDFFVLDTAPTQCPVAGVVVKVLSENGAQVFSQVVTDGCGHAGFLLPSGQTYQVRMYKFAVALNNPQYVTVLPSPLPAGQSNRFTFSATLVAPPLPTDSRLCTAYGHFRDITGAAQAGVEIHIVAKFDPVWVDGAGVVTERVIVRTNRDGYVQVNLFRHAHYDCTVQGEEEVVRHLVVPDAPNVNLPDLLFPVVSAIVLTPGGPYTLAVGQELPVGMQVYASNGENLRLGIGDIFLASSNPDILSYAFSPGGLVLVGVGIGTAQIDIRRANRSIVRIPDHGIAGQPVVATVTAR